MSLLKMSLLAVTGLMSLSASFAVAAKDSKKTGTDAIHSMAGCYLVDYLYTETESLKEGYSIDPRVYDVNRNRSVKEWIYTDDFSDSKIRLQHLLFATDLNGKMVEGSQLKHQAEDWEFNAAYLYDFVSPLTWDVVRLPAASQNQGLWTRRITNLDDGPRYQCAAPWLDTGAYPEWTCANYSPIPGRETRDMKRADYNTLQRTTQLRPYGTSWLERQDNVKTIDNKAGLRTQLAKELGKNWYVRLPDSECSEIRDFAQPRKAFWSLLRQTWEEVLNGHDRFVEKPLGPNGPRYAQMFDVEETYIKQDLSNPLIRKAAHDAIVKIIQDNRE